MNKCNFCNYSCPSKDIIHGWDCSLKDQTTTRVRVCNEALQNMTKYAEIRAKNDTNKINETDKTEILQDLKLTLCRLYNEIDSEWSGDGDPYDALCIRPFAEKYGWTKEEVLAAEVVC